MAEKRQASSDLNHDNWDNEDEPEERGTFRTASEEELKNRVIKKAKRKIASACGTDQADGDLANKSVFSGFSGFGKSATNSGAPTSPFSFLSKITTVAGAISCGVSSSTTNSVTAAISCGTGFKTSTTVAKAAGGIKVCPSGNKISEYHSKLSKLNQAVCEWIKTHVDKNPLCILSPIFKDYEKYLAEIENEKRKVNLELNASEIVEIGKSTNSDNESFKFPIGTSHKSFSTNISSAPVTTFETTTKSNGFSFGIKKLEDHSMVNSTKNQTFSFGINPSITPTTVATPSLSFGSVSEKSIHPPAEKTTFSFNPVSSNSIGNTENTEQTTTSTSDPNEENEEPPKNEFKQVIEDDAFYSKKCKVFLKKGENFVDKGVGTLYLKPIDATCKTQLLVRADTNLGNILVNLILNSTIPVQRMGKNNVMMVCLPSPDIEKPTPTLLRVKTSDEADELLEIIEKYKK